jgi:hypothetical protein
LPRRKKEESPVDSISLNAGMDIMEHGVEWTTPEVQTASAIIEEVKTSKVDALREHLNRFREIPPTYTHQELDQLRGEQFIWVMRLRELLNG